MKAKLLLLCIFYTISSPAFLLDCRPDARLYDQLCEVNAEWRRIEPRGVLLDDAAFSSDRQRIQKHLELVEQALRNRDISRLSASQRANRLHHLDVLRDYRLSGTFPTNHYHPGRRPYFRDNFGVLCAVGYLLWQDGKREIVDRINREDNYGYLRQLAAEYPEIGAWAAKNGFTTEELAWIQPYYEAPKPMYQPWGNGSGPNAGGWINVMEKNGVAESLLFVAGHFDQIGGIDASNIAAWDGQNWHPLGAGVMGEVYDMQYSGQKLYVAGDFYLPGSPDNKNIAVWDGNTWTGIQSGDMEGKVFAVCVFFNEVYLGGDFRKINGQPASYAAEGNKLPSGAFEWVNTDVISVDSTVRSIEIVADNILFGGDFTHTSVNSTAGNQLTVNHLAYWDYNNWLTGISGNIPCVSAIQSVNGYLLTGHRQEFFYLASLLNAGVWTSMWIHPYNIGEEDGLRGFFNYDDRYYMYGNITGGDLSSGSGLLVFAPEYKKTAGFAGANGTVRAAIGFQNNIYLAGDFTKLHGDPYPGIARIQLAPVSADEPMDGLPVRVSTASDHISLKYESLEQRTAFRVYDLQGRLMVEKTLIPGEMESILDAGETWTNGLHIWQLQNASGARSGKWAVMR